MPFFPYVERGDITLIGATTQNPSFEVIAPLLSRAMVVVLKSLNDEALGHILDRALSGAQTGAGNFTRHPHFGRQVSFNWIWQR